jgi:hypothetical protein
MHHLGPIQSSANATQLGKKEIKWANNITLEKNGMSFCPKNIFSYEWILFFFGNCY